MSSRLRSLDSKISFFAFADIITAVSGVLIFVALLLATDLGRPTASRSPTTSSPAEQQLQEILERQLEVDAQNQRLEELLATAETSPDPAKLQADITSLRAELFQEQQKQAVLSDQLSASQAALAERDRVLGLTDLNTTVTRLLQQVAAILTEDSTAHKKMDELQGQVAHAESQLLKLHQRQNQIWLIPERSLTSKEPVLVTVSRTNAIIDRFDRPDQRLHLAGEDVFTTFPAYLHHLKTNDQYIVFLIKPTGVFTFNKLVDSAREQGFEVGYDALEENRLVNFATPPPLDGTTAVPFKPSETPGSGTVTGTSGSGTTGRPSPGPGNGSSTGIGGYGGHGGSASGSGGYGGSVPGPGGDGGPATGAGGNGNSGTGAGGAGSSSTGSGQPNGSGTNAGGEGKAPGSGQNGSAAGPSHTNNPHATATTTTTASTPPPAKSWWQRLLEWLGFK